MIGTTSRNESGPTAFSMGGKKSAMQNTNPLLNLADAKIVNG